MIHLITGVAGFVGSNLAAQLLSKSMRVIGVDNFHLGSEENFEKFRDDPNFEFLNHDMSDLSKISELQNKLSGKKISYIWHLAANSDIQAGVKDSLVDLKLTFLTSYVAIELSKKLSIPNFIMASTSAVYGELAGQLSELSSPLMPISNYGAMKLSSESLIGPCLEQGMQRAFVFRFPNVVGVPATHGVIFDFINKLKKTPGRLQVLGDGTQKKCYMHVSELINAMLHCLESVEEKGLHCFNVGPRDNGVTVKQIAEKVVSKISPDAEVVYGAGNKGWIGDVPSFEFNVSKIEALDWTPRLTSENAIDLAVAQISEQLL
jgi:UDP-glucose 4-epimerase